MAPYPKINELDLYMWSNFLPEYTNRTRTWFRIAKAVQYIVSNLYKNDRPDVVEPLKLDSIELDIIKSHIDKRSRVLCAVYIIAWERTYGLEFDHDHKNKRIQQEDANTDITLHDTLEFCPALFQGIKWMLKGRHCTEYFWSMIPKHYPDTLWEEEHIDMDDFTGGLTM